MFKFYAEREKENVSVVPVTCPNPASLTDVD